MSLLGVFQAAAWPFRTAVSTVWAALNMRDRSPVPAATSVSDAAAMAAILSAHYKPDPWDGRLDLSEDPRRVQYHLERGTLGLLTAGLDCDDLAFHTCARLRELAGPPGSTTNHVLILTDSNGKYSHAVCEFWVAGQHWVIDTNGCHNMAGWPSVSARFKAIYPGANYTDEMRVAYDFGDPGRV